jgi:hypothetical protein
MKKQPGMAESNVDSGPCHTLGRAVHTMCQHAVTQSNELGGGHTASPAQWEMIMLGAREDR